MAEKSDDIKNLFMNLGLNPNDYHEIRTAPTANATVAEAPRRWSLLQAAPAPKSLNSVVPGALPAGTPPPASASVASLMAAVAPPAPAPVAAPVEDASALPAALFAAARDILRAEEDAVSRGGMPSRSKLPDAAPRTVEPAPAPAPAPAALTIPPRAEPRGDGLESLFQSVKEPVTQMPTAAPPAPERRTDQLRPGPVATTPTQRVAAFDAAARGDDVETRYLPPPAASRLGPVPAPAPAPLPTLPPAAPLVAGGVPPPLAAPRIRVPQVAAPAAPVHGESLQDVFARLSRQNRG